MRCGAVYGAALPSEIVRRYGATVFRKPGRLASLPLFDLHAGARVNGRSLPAVCFLYAYTHTYTRIRNANKLKRSEAFAIIYDI